MTNPANNTPDSITPERVYLGDGPVFAEGTRRDYYILIPSDGDIDQRTLRKASIADVLRRNGRVVDDRTLEQMTELWKQPDGGYDFLKKEYGGGVSAMAAQEWDGRAERGEVADGSIFGYSLFSDMKYQEKVLGQAVSVQGPPLGILDDKTFEEMAEVFKGLTLLVKASGNEAAIKPLEAITKALETKDKAAVEQALLSTASAGNGTAAIFEAFNLLNEKGLGVKNQGVMEQVRRLTSPDGLQKMDAIEGMARFAKVFSMPGDAAGIYLDTHKLAKGVDDSGKPLTGTQRAETLVSLTSNAASLTAGGAELASALAERYGYKALAGGAGTVGAYAGAIAFGANIAAVQVAMMKVVIDGVGEMKSAMAESDIGRLVMKGNRNGATTFERIAMEQQEVQGYAANGVNAYASARRIVESMPGTKVEVWESYLAKAIDPPSLAYRVFAAENQAELKATVSQAEIERFVKGAKEARGNFIEATTRGVINQLNTSGPFDRDADILKQIKITSLSPETIERKQQEQKELEKNPLIPKTEPLKLGPPFKQIRKDAEQQFKQQSRSYTPDQLDIIAADATANFLREGGKTPTATILSNDGARLFVVDGTGDGKLRTQIEIDRALSKDLPSIAASLPKPGEDHQTQATVQRQPHALT